MVQTCQNQVRRLNLCHLAVARIEELPFAELCFDSIICAGVLEYVLNEDQALNEIIRVLKPNGILVLSLLNSSSPYQMPEN